MKLEIKDLAPYLPYGLKFGKEGQSFHEFEMAGINKLAIVSTTGKVYSIESLIKPILRPLSELRNDIEHNGNKFVPFKELRKHHPNCPNFYGLFNPQHVWEYHQKKLTQSYTEYVIIQRLIEWHFDVFGLIPKGLAIDINTL